MKLPYLYTAIVLTLLLSANAKAQNMVPNGSFEQYTACPNGFSQISRATGWSNYHGSPDYFNSCATVSGFSVPSSLYGYQPAASGNAFGGIVCGFSSITREFQCEAATCTITPLSVGTWYQVSMSVSLANASGYALNNLGAFFYKRGATTVTDAELRATTPQVSYRSYGNIKDTADWIRVTDYFYADSAYDHISISLFGVPIKIDTLSYTTNTFSYHYIDSITVSIPRLAPGITVTDLCLPDTLVVPFIIPSSSSYGTGNVFTLQLSGPTGSFSNPLNLASITGNKTDTFRSALSAIAPSDKYRVRIISSSPADTTYLTRNIAIGATTPDVTTDSSYILCYSSSVLLPATSTFSGVSYSWTGPNNFHSDRQYPVITYLTEKNTGPHIVTVSYNGCEATDTLMIYIIPRDTVKLNSSSNSPICVGDTIKLYGSPTGPVSTVYGWSGKNGFLSSSIDTMIINADTANAGDYIFSGMFASCVTSKTVNVVVDQKPNLSAGTDIALCEDETLRLSATSDSGTLFKWSGPNGYSSRAKDTTIVNAQMSLTGDYILTGQLNNCTMRDSVYVAIKPIPTGINIFSNSPLCVGDELKLTGSATTTGAFNWQGPGNFSSSQKNTGVTNVQKSHAGNYMLTVDLNGCKQQDTIQVQVNDLPEKPDAASNSPLTIGDILKLTVKNVITNVNYNWTGPNNFSSTLPNTNINQATLNNAGTYIVTATQNACTSADTIIVDIIKADSVVPFKVFPNPNNGNFKIQASVKRDQSVPIGITAANGQLVYQTSILTKNKVLDTDITLKDFLSSGTYTLTLYLDGEKYVVRLLVVRG